MMGSAMNKYARVIPSLCVGALIAGLIVMLAHPALAQLQTKRIDTKLHDVTLTSSKQMSVNVRASGFKIFDGTLYRNKPGPTAPGMRRMCMIYEWDLGYRVHEDVAAPTVAEIQQAMRKCTTQDEIIVLDIERFPLRGASSIAFTESVQKLNGVLTTAMTYRPSQAIPIGYYAFAPMQNYYQSAAPASSGYNEWVVETNKLKPVTDRTTVILPSIYTFTPDRTHWVAQANGNLKEARRVAGNKPVYVFLMPHYMENTGLDGQDLPADYFRLQLDTVYNCKTSNGRSCADGVIIWGGYLQNWSNTLPWYTTLKAFKTANRL